MSKPRDVVVVRVSEKGDREDEHFHSPEVQIEGGRGDRTRQRGSRWHDPAAQRAWIAGPAREPGDIREADHGPR